MGFQLLFKDVVTIIKGVCNFDVAGSYGCVKFFKFLSHLGVGAHTAILLKSLYNCNFLLLEGPFCFGATAVHKVFIGFLYRLSQNFQKKMVNINKLVNK